MKEESQTGDILFFQTFSPSSRLKKRGSRQGSPGPARAGDGSGGGAILMLNGTARR